MFDHLDYLSRGVIHVSGHRAGTAACAALDAAADFVAEGLIFDFL